MILKGFLLPPYLAACMKTYRIIKLLCIYGVAGDGKRESCREEATVIFPKLLLIGEMSSSGRKHDSLQLNLYSFQQADLPCKAGRRALDLKVKRNEEGPSPFAVLSAPAAHPGYWLLGWHPPDPNRWSLQGKGAKPPAPGQSARGKWLPELELTFGSGLFMQLKGHTVWKQNAISPQPSTDYGGRSEAEAGSATTASIFSGHPFPSAAPFV